MTNTEERLDILEEITPMLAFKIKEKIATLIKQGSPQLTVYFDSRGGCIVSGLDIHKALKEYPGNTTGVVVGAAESMAAIILQACRLRHCERTGHVLIHHLRPSMHALNSFVSDEHERRYFEQLQMYELEVNTILSKRTGRSPREINKQCATDRPLSSKKALSFGLIDKII